VILELKLEVCSCIWQSFDPSLERLRKYVRSFVVDGLGEHLHVEISSDLSHMNVTARGGCGGSSWGMVLCFVGL
jgi:hypothetical protein